MKEITLTYYIISYIRIAIQPVGMGVHNVYIGLSKVLFSRKKDFPKNADNPFENSRYVILLYVFFHATSGLNSLSFHKIQKLNPVTD